MPPGLRSRTGAKPKRKPRTRPGWKAGAGLGGPPQKAAPTSQPSAAEEGRRLRQQNCLTLEDEAAVERSLEELVFSDVEDQEDALLRRVRGPRLEGHKDWATPKWKMKQKVIFHLKRSQCGRMKMKFWKDRMKNASESELSKDNLKMRLKEVFQHAMGGVAACAETHRRKMSSADESEQDEDDFANGEEVSATSTHSKALYVYDMLAGKLILVHQVRGLKEDSEEL
ncbi:hypothetical protein P7K49_028152 [Saguinus oedipus]|uniref:Uncharacterized protein n=1 Tax=Saguinus oedipus TaxID=9490 RepID=A0ABQ9UBG3_SAGOE|nr:hypothetical protein P7K49_028152 [Saguinus oedipus]